MTALTFSSEPIPGWVVVRRHMEAEFAALEARVERAPLTVGGADTMLTVEQYSGWVNQQTSMIASLGRLLPPAVANISAAANRFDETTGEAEIAAA